MRGEAGEKLLKGPEPQGQPEGAQQAQTGLVGGQRPGPAGHQPEADTVGEQGEREGEAKAEIQVKVQKQEQCAPENGPEGGKSGCADGSWKDLLSLRSEGEAPPSGVVYRGVRGTEKVSPLGVGHTGGKAVRGGVLAQIPRPAVAPAAAAAAPSWNVICSPASRV